MAGPHDFPETRQSVWAAIRDGRRGLEKVLGLYRDPITAWLRRQGLALHDAEDVTQDVLARLADGVLAGADPKKGRLRALVKAVSRHALADFRRHAGARKRGGAATQVPLDELATDEADDFDTEWALNLVLQAIYRLLDGADDGARRQVDAVYQSAFKGLGTEELSEHLAVTPQNAKVLLHRGRKRVAAAVRELIEDYAAREELAAEVAYVRRLLPRDVAEELA